MTQYWTATSKWLPKCGLAIRTSTTKLMLELKTLPSRLAVEYIMKRSPFKNSLTACVLCHGRLLFPSQNITTQFSHHGFLTYIEICPLTIQGAPTVLANLTWSRTALSTPSTVVNFPPRVPCTKCRSSSGTLHEAESDYNYNIIVTQKTSYQSCHKIRIFNKFDKIFN